MLYCIPALVALWLWGLHRKMVRLSHQRAVHFARLTQALLRRRSLVVRLGERLNVPPLPEPPPFDDTRLDTLAAHEARVAETGWRLADTIGENTDPVTRRLINELAATERRIDASRQIFNEATMAINVRVETLPTGWFARLMGHSLLPYFCEG